MYCIVYELHYIYIPVTSFFAALSVATKCSVKADLPYVHCTLYIVQYTHANLKHFQYKSGNRSLDKIIKQ
jgi:hypothetical protein